MFMLDYEVEDLMFTGFHRAFVPSYNIHHSVLVWGLPVCMV